ncbi:MAG: ABC transporter substrate-binding protein [Lachnospiraceae bacterium]|nr:ABC transporter substrate-binding protein [Lachnospiraceae bacterium]
MKFNTVKKMTALMLAGVLAAGFTGCGSSAPAEKAASEAEAASENAEETAEATEEAAEESDAELTEFDVVLDWYPNAIHTFLYDAIDKGYFAEEGLKVNLIDPAESVDGLNFVATGRAQVGLTYMLEICQAKENGMPVKALASVCQRELDCLTSLASNEGITEDMSCLKGKKVGFSGATSEEAIIRTIAENNGLTTDDYEMVNVGFDLSTSLTTESVDLVTGMFINDEIITLRNEGYDINVYDQLEYGIPQMYGLVMAVNDEDYEANTEQYEGFLRACAKGFEDMKADEDAALEIIMRDMNSDENPLDETQQRGSYETLMERMELPDAPFLSMSRELWQNTIDWMVKYELISDSLTPEDVTISLAD